MRIEVLKSKIHRAKITQAELHYVGSIAIDEDLMDAANLIEGEKVTVVNVRSEVEFAMKSSTISIALLLASNVPPVRDRSPFTFMADESVTVPLLDTMRLFKASESDVGNSTPVAPAPV